MIFEETPIKGAVLIRQQAHLDSRGYFSRMFCKNEFLEHGICAEFVQSNLSQNREANTLRGLHVQRDGAEEDKLVICTRGKIFDVCVDVRRNSETFGNYVGMELSEENGNMLFIPKGCAHGYLTRQEDCQILYFMSEFYKPRSYFGYRYDEPLFGIQWPQEGPYILSEQDQNWDYINKAEAGL